MQRNKTSRECDVDKWREMDATMRSNTTLGIQRSVGGKKKREMLDAGQAAQSQHGSASLSNAQL